MLPTYRSLYDRSVDKTPEKLFINSLRKEFELSPAESHSAHSIKRYVVTFGRLLLLLDLKISGSHP